MHLICPANPVDEEFAYIELHRETRCYADLEKKWKRRTHHTVRTVPKYNRKILETEAKYINIKNVHDRPLGRLGRDTSLKSDGVKLVLCGMLLCGHVSVFTFD